MYCCAGHNLRLILNKLRFFCLKKKSELVDLVTAAAHAGQGVLVAADRYGLLKQDFSGSTIYSNSLF